MYKCPITYQASENKYSKRGLAKIAPRLKGLNDLPYTAKEQRVQAATRAVKMSIQGFQPKLSAKLSIKNQEFIVVDNGGTFIVKPQSELFTQVPENEDLTMKMAKIFGIQVPLTGLVYSKDGSLSYFIKRFDRYGHKNKYHQEDFAQLTGNTRDTKYRWSMEKLIPVLDNFCTFPLLEKKKLFRRVLFCFLTGNEDMHLKNFSLITKAHKIELSPAYDLLNSTISMINAKEELALPLAGKKRNIKRKDLFDYYGLEKLQLSDKTIDSEMKNVIDTKGSLKELISLSFLNDEMKTKYNDLMDERYNRLST